MTKTLKIASLLIIAASIFGCGGGGEAVEPSSRQEVSSLNSSDGLTQNNAYFEDHSFRVNERSRVTFQMASDTLDPFIGILRPNETIVAYDDDSGPGLDAYLSITLDPGSYVLRCTDRVSGPRSGVYAYGWRAGSFAPAPANDSDDKQGDPSFLVRRPTP